MLNVLMLNYLIHAVGTELLSTHKNSQNHPRKSATYIYIVLILLTTLLFIRFVATVIHVVTNLIKPQTHSIISAAMWPCRRARMLS